MSTCASVNQPDTEVSMLDFFKTVYGKETHSDVTIKFSDRLFHGHKVVLCTRSEYFDKLCGEDSQFLESSQKVVELKGDNAGAVELMLMHLYFATYDLHAKSDDWRFHAEIVRVADKYLVRGLKSKALAKCIDILTAITDPI